MGFGWGWRLAPIEEAAVIRTGGHAHATADASVLVDEDGAFGSAEGSGDKTNVYAGGILAVLAWGGYELSTAAGEFVLEDLCPFHRLWYEMAFDAGGGALWRSALALASVAKAQVDDHAPLADAAVVRLGHGTNGTDLAPV